MMRLICRTGIPVVFLMFLLFSFQNLLAQDSFVLTFFVRSPEGSALPGAAVHVLNTSRTGIADKEGKTMFSSLGRGTYLVECTAVGYASYLQVVNLQGHTEITIQLIPKSQQLDEVVVTAEKREAALQQLPLSVTSFSSEQLANYRIWNSRDLSSLSPNIYSTHSGDERNVTGIRGITTTSYTPAVATYIDGVGQFSLDTYIANLFDVERVEILRGPQGTLYGRNAMGGVINVITRQPRNETEATAELNFGNFGLQRHSIAVRFPLVKNRLFMGMAVQLQKRDGYYTNAFSNSSFDKQRMFVNNYFIHYSINRHWTLRLNSKQQQQENEGTFPLIFGVQQAFDEPFQLNYNAVGRMKDRTGNLSLVAQYDGPGLLLTAQTAFQRNYRYYQAPLDGDFSPLDAITIANDYGRDWNNVKVWTQEIRLSNPAGKKSPMQWTAGVYLFRQDNPVKQATNFGADAGLLGIPDANSSLINSSREKVNGQALFGQVNYELARGFSVIGGVRADREEKELAVRGEYEKTGVGNFVTRTDTASGKVFAAVSPKFGFQYQPSKTQQYYITWSRGFRPGGFTPMNSDPSLPPLYPYDPEYGSTAEIGTKHKWLNGRLIFNWTAFYTWVSNIQVPTLVLPDAITLIRNTGKMVSRGMELEGSILPMAGWQIDYAFGMTNASYRSLTIASNGQTLDLKGKKQLFTPDRTGLVAMQYQVPLNKKRMDQVLFRGEWVFTGNTYFDFGNTIKQSSYSLFNARVGWAGKKAEIYGWGRNLLDKRFIAYAYDFGAVHLGNPGTWGITLIGKL